MNHEPARNDLGVFLNPGNRRQTWVKRVVAFPGDTVEMKKGVVYLNGKALEEIDAVALDQADVSATTVPEYDCYVLGDHRAHL